MSGRKALHQWNVIVMTLLRYCSNVRTREHSLAHLQRTFWRARCFLGSPVFSTPLLVSLWRGTWWPVCRNSAVDGPPAQLLQPAPVPTSLDSSNNIIQGKSEHFHIWCASKQGERLRRETVVSSCSKALQLLSKMRQNLRGLPIYLFFGSLLNLKPKELWLLPHSMHGFEGMTCICADGRHCP